MGTIKMMREHWFVFTLFSIISLFVGMAFISYLSGFQESQFYVIKTTSSVFLAVGVIYAARQFHLNKNQLSKNDEWNRQQLAMTEVYKANEKLEKIIKKLKENFDYAERDEPYKLSEIHGKFGTFSEDGKTFDFNDGGKEFKNDIITLLNTFEYIATGVNLGIFDEEVVKHLTKGRLLYAFKMFESYITHLRHEHNWENVYSELEKLSKKWAAQ